MVTRFDHSIRELVGYWVMSEINVVYGHSLWTKYPMFGSSSLISNWASLIIWPNIEWRSIWNEWSKADVVHSSWLLSRGKALLFARAIAIISHRCEVHGPASPNTRTHAVQSIHLSEQQSYRRGRITRSRKHSAKAATRLNNTAIPKL